MKKISIVLSIIVVTAMLLTACGADEDNPNVPGTGVPSATTVVGTETVEPTTAANGTTTPGIPVTGNENPARLSNQLDFTVWNKNGEQIGEVNDMVLDLDNSQISYVIVGAGGFLGLGEKDVLVPWNSLKLETAGTENTGGHLNAFILEGNQDRFTNAPDFDVHSILPKVGTPAADWDDAVRTFWETGNLPSTATPEATVNPDMTATPAAEVTGTPEAATTMDLQGVMLASDALDASVRVRGQDDGQNDMEAEVDDMIIDPQNGKLQYIVIDSTFDDGEHWIPVPLTSLQWDAQDEAFILNIDAATLQTAPFLRDNQYPDMLQGSWDKEFAQFWQKIGAGAPSPADATPTP